ncbi:MAG: hypothetical protein PVG39_18070 [Desulfobacteraceae bacterium]|jgi:hypothetical protein
MSQKIIIDESFPNSQVEDLEIHLKRKKIKYSSLYYISQKHPGMPDHQIIQLLLDEKTVFITTDRPMHNTVLKKGFKSFFFNGDNFSPKPLKGIRPIKLPPQVRKDLQPKSQYAEQKTEVRHLVLPKAEKSLKKLRTKRRRIRNYFGGIENMDMAAVTISFESFKSSVLIGVRIKISSNTGAKALDASESYISEKAEPENRAITAMSYALILPIQLMLNHVKTIIYYDTRTFAEPNVFQGNGKLNQYQFLFKKLLGSYPEIEFMPSAKGFFIERLRRKLNDLTMFNSNEIVQGSISEMINEVQEYYLIDNDEKQLDSSVLAGE